MTDVLRAWGLFERGFEVLALGEICLWGAWGQLKSGFEVLALGEISFEGMRALEKGA